MLIESVSLTVTNNKPQNHTKMKKEELIKLIKKEIERLKEVSEKEAWVDERWESEVMGRIESLEWVSEKIGLE
jgi:protoporphyrinogen oxidase